MVWPSCVIGGSSSVLIAPCTARRARARSSSLELACGLAAAGTRGDSLGVCSTIGSRWPIATTRRPRTSTERPASTRTPSTERPLTVPRSSTRAPRASKRITACHDDEAIGEVELVVWIAADADLAARELTSRLRAVLLVIDDRDD